MINPNDTKPITTCKIEALAVKVMKGSIAVQFDMFMLENLRLFNQVHQIHIFKNSLASSSVLSLSVSLEPESSDFDSSSLVVVLPSLSLSTLFVRLLLIRLESSELLSVEDISSSLSLPMFSLEFRGKSCRLLLEIVSLRFSSRLWYASRSFCNRSCTRKFRSSTSETGFCGRATAIGCRQQGQALDCCDHSARHVEWYTWSQTSSKLMSLRSKSDKQMGHVDSVDSSWSSCARCVER